LKLATKTLIVGVITILLMLLLEYLKIATESIPYVVLFSPLVAIAGTIVYRVLIRMTRRFKRIETILEAGGPIETPKSTIYMSAGGTAATILISALLYELGYYTYVSKVLLAGLLVTALFSMIIFMLPKTRADTRGIREEDELPYLITYMRSLIDSHISFAELVDTITRLTSLKAWAKEMQIVVNFAKAFRVSITTAMYKIAEYHPSKEIAAIMKRIAVMGETKGDLRDLLDRLSTIYIERFFAKLSKTYDVINEVFMTAQYMIVIIPLLSVIFGPISGMSTSILILASYGAIFMVGFLLITLFYMNFPKMLIRKTGQKDKIVAIIGYTLLLSNLLYFVISSYPIYKASLILAGISAPFAIYTAKKIYDERVFSKFITTVLDTIEESASLGENVAFKLVERAKKEKNKKVSVWLNRLAESVIQPRLIDALKRIAPTRLHELFLESFQNIVRYGAKIKAFESMTKVFENVIEKSNTIKSKAGQFSLTTIVISVVLGGLLGMIINVMLLLSGISNYMMTSASGGFALTMFNFSISPQEITKLAYSLLVAVVVFSISSDTGKHGTFVYGISILPIALLLFGISYHFAYNFMSSYSYILNQIKTHP